MSHIITELSKYTMVILLALYTYLGFSALRKKCSGKKKRVLEHLQIVYLLLFHLNANAVLYISTENTNIILLYFAELVFFVMLLVFYYNLYPNSSRLIANHMCMLMAIGFVMLTRLSFETALKQFAIGFVSMLITLLIPYIIAREKSTFRKLTALYAIAGIGLLGVVAVLGATTKGANLSITIAGITIQPSEFVKIIFVFMIAGMLYRSTDFLGVVKVSILAGIHVLILVASKDLGGALIFFVAYLVMIFVATKNPFYFIGGLLGGAAASVVAYHLFAHVRKRVIAWQDPLGHYEVEGNQVSNSLFAIGTGGWFGMGLNQGTPGRIPEVKKDFIFSAISEEFGGIFAICLILVCFSCFLLFLNSSMQMKDKFYQYVALGLGTIYGFQVFLSIGGNIKFIPSTGVTLPFLSYGGSSLLSSFIIFAVLQGLYLMRYKEGGMRSAEAKK